MRPDTRTGEGRAKAAGESTGPADVRPADGPAPAAAQSSELVKRAEEHYMHGDYAAARDDGTAVIVDPEASPAERVFALLARSLTEWGFGHFDSERAYLDAAVATQGAPQEDHARALLARSCARERRGDVEGRDADLNAIVGLPGAPPRLRALALLRRGDKETLGELVMALLRDYYRASRRGEELPEWRTWVRETLGGDEYLVRCAAAARADYELVLGMDDAPSEQRAAALLGLALMKAVTGDEGGSDRDARTVSGMGKEAGGAACQATGVVFFLRVAIGSLGGPPQAN